MKDEETRNGSRLKVKMLYNTVMTQVISSSGRFLFAGNRFGDIFVQRLIFDEDNEQADTERPKLKLFPQGEQVEINSMCFHRDFLVVGAVGFIYGLKWDEQRFYLSAEHSWEIHIPMHVDAFEVADVNYMWVRPETDHLFAGCGDNVIYQISLEDGRIMRDYRGHTDYLHGVTGSSTDNQLYSASEDGCVRIWNETEKESTGLLEPYLEKHLVRPEMGKWLGALAVSKNDWLICGGGPKLSIWHLRAGQCIREFEFPGPVHVCDFVEDNIFVAGEYNHAQFYSMTGELESNIPVENTATYSAVWQIEPKTFMSIAGFSNKLHILNDFRFLNAKIDMYGNTE